MYFFTGSTLCIHPQIFSGIADKQFAISVAAAFTQKLLARRCLWYASHSRVHHGRRELPR